MTSAISDDAPATEAQDEAAPPVWLRASIADVQDVDFEAPIAGSTAAEVDELGDKFRSVLPPQDGEQQPEDAAVRVFNMLEAVVGMRFTPEHRNEPFSAMMVLAGGRRSPIPEDFRGDPLNALALMAERAINPVLRARLSDVCWLLDRKRGQLAIAALSSYVEIVRKIDAGELKLRFEKEESALHYKARNFLRRALQIGRAIGWDKPETIRARNMVTDLRQRANAYGAPIPIRWFSELDLDSGVSDPAIVAGGIDEVLKAIPECTASHTVVDLWRLAARAYRAAKREDDAHRCQFEAAERLVAEAESALSKQNSAMLASRSLSAAIAELHGIPGKKERRTELRHRLIDVQARIPEELSVFTQEMDLREIARHVEKSINDVGFFDKMLVFASLCKSPDPDTLVKEAAEAIRQHPLASFLPTTHLDSEGKVMHRTGGGLGDGENDSAIQRQIAQSESIRRKLVAHGEIDVARRAVSDQHYLSDDVFAALLQYSPFVPHDLIATFARGFSRLFRGDSVSATYILTPLLENSLRHVLKGHGHDVTIFDDATQTQQDRTISSLFEQMRAELDSIFTRATTTDIESVFLKRPGPNLRHSVAHGLLHDGDPYGADAIYGCWLIMRLCLMPLFRHADQLRGAFEGI